MEVNSAKAFRSNFKERRYRQDVNPDFMGYSRDENGEFKEYGFFNLFHGEKPNIDQYLPSLLDIAEDNQAIYEFLQNAVDCKATSFWAFYDDNYFLAINNGAKFDQEGLTSILNIAQSTKKDPDSIGRLGIGFKLVHRLVGKGNGVKELLEAQKGPIVFSWGSASQLEAMMNIGEQIVHDGFSENKPYLLKICLTNFPTDVDETVIGVNGDTIVPFRESELKELRMYTSRCMQKIFNENYTLLNNGTLFFIKLGENKKILLDSDLNTLRNGIEYSMNKLKQLNRIWFNNELILKKNLEIIDGSIKSGSELFNKLDIDVRYKDYDVLYSFGYIPLDFNQENYYTSVSQLRQSPNFYKYFPMGDEVNNMALFVHCDSFQIEANRRKLTKHHTNELLLPEIAESIIKKIEEYKNIGDWIHFYQLYAAILLTDKPSSEEKRWMDSKFFDILYTYIKTNIPTLSSIETNSNNVKIKKIALDIPLEKIGLGDIKWFKWSGSRNNEEIVNAAMDKNNPKLQLEAWNINNIIEKSDIAKLNLWLSECSNDVYDSFIKEIKTTNSSNAVKQRASQIKLFKFGSDRKSNQEVDTSKAYIILTEKIKEIRSVLEKIGMICSDVTLESHPLYGAGLVKSQDEKKLFENIKIKAEEGYATLSPSEKLSLVSVLSSLSGVGDELIKQLKIFKSVVGMPSCLGRLVPFVPNAEDWKKTYVLCNDENFSEYHKYFISDQILFSDIIKEDFPQIIMHGTSINELYEIFMRNAMPWSSELTIRMIDTYGLTDDVLNLIEKTNDKSSVEKFISKISELSLSSSACYSSSSFEYRVIKISAKVDAISLRDKIKIDGIKLVDFSSSDILNFRCKKDSSNTVDYSIKLSDVLPDDTQCAIYGRVASKFVDIPDYQKIFSANNSNISTIKQKIIEKLTASDVLITASQYLFLLLDLYQNNISNFQSNIENLIRFNNENGSPEQKVIEIITYAYDNGLCDVLIKYKTLPKWYPLLSGKFLFSDDYTLESERAYKSVESWCISEYYSGEYDKRIAFLKDLDIHFNDCSEIKRRKAFKENIEDDWASSVSYCPIEFLDWVFSLDPIVGDNQKLLLYNLCRNPKCTTIIQQKFEERDFDGISKEMNTDKYLRWKESSGNKMCIFLIKTQMPYHVAVKVKGHEKMLCYDTKDEWHYFTDTKHLYIHASEDSEIDAIMTTVYQDDTIPLSYEDFTKIRHFSQYEINLEVIKRIGELKREQEEEEERCRKEKEEAYENFRNKFSEQIVSFMNDGFSMPSDKIKCEHIISRYRILNYIKQNYELQDNFDEKNYIRTDGFAPILLKDGTKVNPQGAKFGIWHLSPNIWRDIVVNKNWTCLCTGNGESHFILIKNEDDIKKLADNTRNLFMRLSPTDQNDILSTIKRVYPNQDFIDDDDFECDDYSAKFDIHLMLMVHRTSDQGLNSLFDRSFRKDENDFEII